VGFFKNTGNTKDSNDSSKSDPKRNQTRLNFRMIGCVALGYIAFGLFRTPPPEEAMNPIIRIGVASLFMGFAVVMGIITIREYIIIWRTEKKAQQEAAEVSEISEQSEAKSKTEEYEKKRGNDEETNL